MTISARLGNKDAQFYLALEAERAIAMNGGVNDGDEPDGHTLQGTKSNDGSGDALNNEEVNRQSESSFDSNDSATRVLASLDRLIVPENPSLSEYHPIAPTLTERIGNDGAGVNANHNDCFSLLQEVIAGQKLDGEARKQARIAIHKSTQLAADGELAEACLHMGHRARDVSYHCLLVSCVTFFLCALQLLMFIRNPKKRHLSASFSRLQKEVLCVVFLKSVFVYVFPLPVRDKILQRSLAL